VGGEVSEVSPRRLWGLRLRAPRGRGRWLGVVGWEALIDVYQKMWRVETTGLGIEGREEGGCEKGVGGWLGEER